MTSDNLSQKISKLHRQIEDLRIRGIDDINKGSEALSGILKAPQVDMWPISPSLKT
jgi:hypothetical protein